MQDHLSDLLIRLKHAQKVNALEVKLFKPTTMFCVKVLQVLYKEGYIRGYVILNLKPLTVTVYLKYTHDGVPVISQIKRISKPSKRVYVGVKSLWHYYSGLGTVIVTNPKGVMTDSDARFLNLGGEALFSIL